MEPPSPVQVNRNHHEIHNGHLYLALDPRTELCWYNYVSLRDGAGQWQRRYNIGFEALRVGQPAELIDTGETWYTAVGGTFQLVAQTSDSVHVRVDFPSPVPTVHGILDSRIDRTQPPTDDNLREVDFPNVKPHAGEREIWHEGGFGYQIRLTADAPFFDVLMQESHGHFDYFVPVVNLGWVDDPQIPRYMLVQNDRTYDSYAKDDFSGPRWLSPRHYLLGDDQDWVVFYSREADAVTGFAWLWPSMPGIYIHASRNFVGPVPYTDRDRVDVPHWGRPYDYDAEHGIFHHSALQQSYRPSDFTRCRGLNDPNLFIPVDQTGTTPWVRYLFFQNEPLPSDEAIIDFVEQYRLVEGET